jgi:hypothetical protein
MKNIHDPTFMPPSMPLSLKKRAPNILTRGGNRTGRVGFGFGFGLDGSGQFNFLEEIGLGRVGSDQFIYYVFSDR